MALTSLRALLFATGGVVAVGGTAYVSGAFDRQLPAPAPAQVAAVAPAETAPPAVAPGTQARIPAAPGADTTAPAAPAVTPPSAAAPAPAAGVVAPTFDIVRVERDGSVVIAGKAAPDSKVEIIHGSIVLGEAKAGPTGEFAVVLDDPLKPGDYQIVLRSTAPDSVVATSEQTAVVSVPEKAGGQVLAMVEEPGKPAELLTVPEPETKAEAPATPAPAAPVAPSSETPAAPAASVASAGPTEPAGETPAKPGKNIVVEAVEIDGSKVFVAGTAEPGRKVRAYANDILLGDAVTSPDGHFLVEAKRDIPVGNYTVRVDALEPDGVKVVARATVPFEREPGETIAAVAANEPKPAEPSAAPVTGAPAGAPVVAEAPAADAQGNVPETTAPKLQHADGAVIIRRGDSLWRISRRVYGHGIRYSTIYLANQKQISDPDRIWPGQVFTVPEKSKEGETADMKAMGEQVTTPIAQ